MAQVTREKKLADMLGNSLDTLDINYGHVVFSFSQKGSALHSNMFDLVLSFLNYWAGMYQSGAVQPGQKIYTMCQLSDRMVRALNG